MAVTKIKPVKSALKQQLDYIQNPDKTDGKMLVSSFGCSYETADAEFGHTLSKAMDKGNNLAHHLIQSFEPGESTPEQAHEIGKRLADEILKGKYEYVLTTHTDKGHIHNHCIFCAASFLDNRKYISNRKSYYAIRNASDRLCKEYGLTKVLPGKERGKGMIEFLDKEDGRRKTRPARGQGVSYAEYAADQSGGSHKSKLKSAIDGIIPQSKNFEDFLRRLGEQGYEIKRGKYISVRAPGQERFTRTKTLGADYTEDAIAKRIAGEYSRDEKDIAALDTAADIPDVDAPAAEDEPAAKALKAVFPSGKLPNLATIQAEYAAITEKKDAIRAEYAALKKAAQEYRVVKKNVDGILNPAEPKAKRMERGTEL
jgi:hypothetical protein